jgi:hypothetical protein
VAIYAERILLARRLAREMNRPVRQLQPWGLLALSATVAVAAGAVSHQLVECLHFGSLLWTLVVGAVAGLVCYAPYLYW